MEKMCFIWWVTSPHLPGYRIISNEKKAFVTIFLKEVGNNLNLSALDSIIYLKNYTNMYVHERDSKTYSG